MRDYALLYINGCRHEVRGAHAFLMLSDYLRCHERLTGTKVVCAEGDCGACAVLMGTPMHGKQSLHYRPITSCIAMMGQFDGTHIITVEGLATSGNTQTLHPAQTSMAACNGAQCGYCTPGIVVALAGLCEQRVACGNTAKLSDAEVRMGLTGNLCRCTGYEAILQAGTSIECADVLSLNKQYPVDAIHPALAKARTDPLKIEANGKLFYKPTTLADACRFKQEHPGCAVLSGGTDLGVLINKGRIDPPTIMSMWGIADFAKIAVMPDELFIGGGASLAALEAATQAAIPELYEIMRRHGSPLIRNTGTLAGNIVNGSPIGDTMPALMVLNAEVELTGIKGSRRVNMNQFYTGYRKTVLQPDELVTGVIIPRPKQGEILKLYKVSKRWDLDISTFTAAFWMKVGDSLSVHSNGNGNGYREPVILEVRIAYGGVGPLIVRLPKTEAILTGQTLTESLAAQAGELAMSEITPISDVRSSADYRFQLAENIALKWYHDLKATEAGPLSHR